MLRYRKVFMFCLFMLFSALCAYAEEEQEDLIDIFESNGKIIAIVEGERKVSFNLRLREKVLWSGSKGSLGAFLTNEHFFALSTSSGAWQALPLKLDESNSGIAFLSANIALLVTGDRVIGFDIASDQFIETRMPIHDELITAKAEKYVAVVITSSRIFGLSTKASAFTEVHIRVRETIESVKATSNKVTILTSDRFLTFESQSSSWKEHKLH